MNTFDHAVDLIDHATDMPTLCAARTALTTVVLDLLDQARQGLVYLDGLDQEIAGYG